MRKYNNGYYERYAKICLRELVDKKFGDYILADSCDSTKNTFPDLIPSNDLESIGVEITRAQTDKEGQTNAWLAQCFGEGLSTDEINKIREKDYHSLELKMENICGTSCLLEDYKKDSSPVDLIKKAISTKLSKLNSPKEFSKKFKSNRLFILIFPTIMLNKKDFNEILEFQQSLDSNRKFDFIYLFDTWQLCTLDFNIPIKYESQSISPELLSKIKKEANPRE